MKRYGQQSVLVAAWMLMALTIAGQAADNPLALRSTSRNIPERGKVDAMQVAVGKNHASFILPAGWRVGSASDEVVIQAGDFSATLTLRVGKDANLASDKIRERILAGAERALVNREFTVTTGLGQATVIDGELAADQNLRLLTRTICIAKDGQTIQFDLKAKPADFPKHQKTLENLVASLRSE